MKTKSLEFCVMIGFLMFSCFLGIGVEACLQNAKIDYWMIPIFGVLIGFPIMLVYIYLFNNKEGLNINALNEKLFGKKIGKFINTIILLFVISFNLITFWNMTSFVSSQYLYNTPSWFITLIFILPAIYMIIKGPRVMFRSCLMLFYIAFLLYIVSGLGLLSQAKITNIYPILENGFSPIIKGIYDYLAYMIMPIFLILIIPKKEIDGKNLNKAMIITYFVTNFLIFFVMFMVISVFGIELTQLYQFPSYHILKRVFVGGFIERMENTLSVQWIIALFTSTMFGYYYTARSLKEIFSLKNKYILIFIVIIMYLSQYIFKNNTLGEIIFTDYYQYFLGVFLFAIPLIIAIRLFYKKKTNNLSFQNVKNKQNNSYSNN